MPLPLIQCTSCRAPVPETAANDGQLVPCASCGSRLQVDIFPALFRPSSMGSVGELVVLGSEASCFYHPHKKAVLPCDGCGRFLCALCDCELRGQHFCPACLEVGRTKGKIKNLEHERTLYDSIALGLAVLPVVLVFGIYFTIITAPMALYMALRYWNAPTSIVRRTKIRHVLAIVFGVIELAGWGLLVYFIIKEPGHG